MDPIYPMQDSKSPSQAPLGRSFRLEELPGAFHKFIEVPAGRQGVALLEGQAPRLLPAGRQVALSFWQRLLGRGRHGSAGWTPAVPFAAWISANHLLSGDGVLLDLALLARLQVIDPVLFYREFVALRGLVADLALELEGSSLHLVLSLVRQYGAEDLVFGLPASRILPLLQPRLQAYLGGLGLACQGIDLAIFHRCEDRVLVARHLAALEEQLRQVAQDKQMAALEGQQPGEDRRLDDFVRQLAPEVAVVPAAQEGQGAPESQPAPKPALEPVPASEPQPAPEPGLEPEAVLEPAPEPAPEPSPEPQTAASAAQAPAAPITPAKRVNLAEALRSWAALQRQRLAQRRRQRLEALLPPAPAAGTSAAAASVPNRLGALRGPERAQADHAVRKMSSSELEHMRQMLNDLRGRVYRQGQEDLALALRGLEKKLEQSAQQVMQPDFGRPGYMQDFQLGRSEWEDQLDFDERLLACAAALTDEAQELQQRFAAQSLVESDLRTFEASLDRWMHRFQGRSHSSFIRSEEV